jgi:hypothetical protein
MAVASTKSQKKAFAFNFDNQTKAITEADAKKGGDDRFWKLTPDDKGEAMAIIRFLPTTEGDTFIKYYNHTFKYQDGGDKFYSGNCVSTFGYDRECPICAHVSEYWNTGFEKDIDIARPRKRKLNYVANIYVVKDANNPECEGKTYLYKFGAKIYEKIKAKWFPSANDLSDPDFKQFIAFDLYEGANFKLKGTNLNVKQNKSGTYPNYDTSEFSPQSDFIEYTEKAKLDISTIMAETKPLAEFIDESKYPKNDVVAKRLVAILGGTVARKEGASDTSGDDTPPPFDMGDDDIPDFSTPDSTPAGVSVEVDPDEAFFAQNK